jgi:hypothetical protein
MSALEAKHVQDSLLRGKDSAATNCANLNGWHGNSDKEIFAIVRSGVMGK